MSDQTVIYLNDYLNDKTLNDKIETLNDVIDYKLELINHVLKDIADKPTETKISELLKLLFYDRTNYYLYYLLGHFYRTANLFDHSRTFYHLSIDLKPDFINNYVDLGLMYQGIDNQLSIRYLKKALEMTSDVYTKSSILFSLSLVYMDAFMYSESVETMLLLINDQLVSEDTRAKASINLGTLRTLMGHTVYDLSYCDTIENIQVLHSKLLLLNNNTNSKYDGLYILNEHLKINNFFKDLKRFYPIKSKQITKSIDSIIKIGFVSSDLRSHVIIKFMFNLLKNLDTSKFEIYIFYNYKLYDPITYFIKNFPLKWFDIINMSDLDVATLVYSEELDILIDLNGHTYGNRLGIFAHKPAPIQMTYLGYPNTTGLLEIDYKITDSVADPIGSSKFYSEELLYIDNYSKKHISFLNYVPMIYNSKCIFFDIAYEWSKKNGEPIIFGSINRPAKNNDELMSIWSKILEKVPSSKILIKIKSVSSERDIINYYLTGLKITEDRLIIVEYQQSNNDYFRVFNKIDILLDTFPYSGTTTTCDALYMSTPVITLQEHGTNRSVHPTNVSASIIKSIGLSELVASSRDEYIDISVKLALDLNRIYNYRETIRTKFLNTNNCSEFVLSYSLLLESLFTRTRTVNI